MLITTLHVNLTSYVLDQSVPIDDLAHSIEEAARSGGSFVPVRTSDGVERSVLITPAVVVELEPLEVADEAFEGETPENAGASQTDSFGDYRRERAPSGVTFSGLEAYESSRPDQFAW